MDKKPTQQQALGLCHHYLMPISHTLEKIQGFFRQILSRVCVRLRAAFVWYLRVASLRVIRRPGQFLFIT